MITGRWFQDLVIVWEGEGIYYRKAGKVETHYARVNSMGECEELMRKGRRLEYVEMSDTTGRAPYETEVS